MIRTIFGAVVLCAALVVPAGKAAADDDTTATCPATATLPFAIPTANGPTDATLSATLTSAGEACSGTFDVAVGGATVGNGQLKLRQDGDALHARFEGTLTSDPFSGTFRGQLELRGTGTSVRGELDAVFCDSSGRCQELESRIPLTTGPVSTTKGENEDENETDDDD